jgi:hypothetical protein
LKRLVLPKRSQQVCERLDWNPAGFDGRQQSDEDRVRRLARVAELELSLPPVQQRERLRCVAYLIAQVVGNAAVRIDRVKVAAQPRRQKPAGNVEIFVMCFREPLTPGLRLDKCGCLRRRPILRRERRPSVG